MKTKLPLRSSNNVRNQKKQTHIFKPLWIALLGLFFFTSIPQVNAQSNIGTDFWLAETPNLGDRGDFAISIVNNSANTANITITNPVNATVNVTITPGSLETYTFGTQSSAIQFTGTYSNNVYHVTSDEVIVVYTFSPLESNFSNDASLILPTTALGKRYRVGSYVSPLFNDHGSTTGVIATEDNTNIQLFNPAGTLVENVTINQGDFFIKNNGTGVVNDMTGWLVLADKNVASYGGSICTAVGNSSSACDHLNEQLIPEESISSELIACPTKSRPIGCTTNCSPDVFRYVATKDNTTISTSPNVGGGTINAGQFIEITTNTPHTVTATNPIYGYQYLISQTSGPPPAGTGDPALLNMPPVGQFLFDYTFLIPASFPNNFINVVAPSGTTFTLDGNAVSATCNDVGNLGETTYCCFALPVTAGVHSITGSNQFGLSISGFDQFASYAYSGGLGLQALNAGCNTGGPYSQEACDISAFQLDGTATCSNGSTPTSILWSSTSAGVSFSDATIEDPQAILPGYGTFEVTLTVTCKDLNDNETTVSCSSTLTATIPQNPLPTITFTAPADQEVNSGVLTGLGSGTPLGGVYSGMGVTDDGNGQTYSFDTAFLDNGPVTITYTFTDGNSCSGSASDDVGVVVDNGICGVDTEAPTIVCPPDIYVPSFDETCGVYISLGVPTIMDNCATTGNALNLENSSNGFKNIPDFTSIFLNSGTATISGWINPRSSNPIFPGLEIYGKVFEINKWQHIALTYDSSTLKIYHNGLLIGSLDANLVQLIDIIENITISSFPFLLDGELDEVRAWNVVRTQVEIQENMDTEIDAQPGLVALYHFNQGIAGGDNTGLITVVDDSGYGNDITLTNFTLNGPTSNWVEGKTFYGVTLTNDLHASYYTPIVEDLGDTTFTWTGTPNFPTGTTYVTWTAKDAAGNTETCIQIVTVQWDIHHWTGAVDTDWTNDGNWDISSPGLSVQAEIWILPGMPNYPVLAAGQNLHVSECSFLWVQSDASLTFNPTVVLTNNATVVADGTITFESDPTGTAYIGEGLGYFYGDFTVERHIPAKRAFRFLSTPVTTSDFIANNWQQDTHITGSTAGANGFDATNTGNPSMYTFDNMNPLWNAISNTDNTNLTAGTPYRLMVRGDRTIDLSDNAPPPTPTTLVSTGELSAENAGTSYVALNETAGGFSFIGNPFQAQVDMLSVMNYNVTNVNPNFYWAWDPNLNVRGAYTTVSIPTGQSTAGSAANSNLQAGQGCFVSTLNTGLASLYFDKSSKVTGQAETNVFKTDGKKSKTIASAGQLRLSLYESSALASNQTEADGLWILFDDNGNNTIDAYDALKFTNLDENLAISNNNTLLSIETRATPIATDEIVLDINTYRNSNYTLVAKGIGLSGEIPFLFDAYTNISTEIPQNGSVEYRYTIDENMAASIAENRFKIVYQAKTLSAAERELTQIQMYPNPTSIGGFYLNIPQNMENLEVTIYNSLGAKLYYNNRFESGRKVSIDTNFTNSQGVYFVELSSEGAKTTKKLIIN